jgi:Outer membrane protein beta-barrel domain
MKSILIFLTAIIIPTAGFCQLWGQEGKQTGNDKIRFGIKAGIAIANLKIEYGPAVTAGDPTFKAGALAGVFLQMPVGKTFSFQPELLLIGKGMKEKSQNYSYRTDLTYLELPLNLLYKQSSAKGSFFIGGGPAPAFYIGENVFYSGYNGFKKFDVGVNVLVGYELPIGFSINLHYTHGLLNISHDRTNVPVTKNRCAGLSVGYLF